MASGTGEQRSRPERPILSFLGGAGSVTGSRFLIETARSTVLVDCGLFQGLKKLRLQNWDPFPIDPAEIDAVVVTHAHVDHIGYLPRLVAGGFRGRVTCTRQTADLAAIVLPDSGHLQEEEAAFANRMGYSKHRRALPLYTEAQAVAALDHLDPRPFAESGSITDDISVELQPAGHILGSATATLRLAESGRTVLFSGDLGRPAHPLLVSPHPPGSPDVVVMESTYGGRRHDDEGAIGDLAAVIERTAGRGGTIVIPAFAVDRTEVVLFHLRQLMEQGRIPRLPVFADSPMALRALAVYREAIARGATDVQPELRSGTDPFDTGNLEEVRKVEDSKALASLTYPSIIVSASGMATGGRVLHHLKRVLPDQRNAVILVGFQAEGTRGRLLAEGRREVKMFGSYVKVRAEVANIRSFSVHADHDELVSWLGSAERAPDTTYLVHGEPAGSETLRESIDAELDWTAVVPRPMERVRLD